MRGTKTHGYSTKRSFRVSLDADTNTATNVSVFTQANSTLGVEFNWATPTNHSSVFVDYTNLVFTPVPYSDSVLCGDTTCSVDLNLSIAGPLTNAGGSVLITSGAELSSSGAPYWGVGQRSIVSGALTAVPVPAAVWLFGSALAGLGWMRRKQTV